MVAILEGTVGSLMVNMEIDGQTYYVYSPGCYLGPHAQSERAMKLIEGFLQDKEDEEWTGL